MWILSFLAIIVHRANQGNQCLPMQLVLHQRLRILSGGSEQSEVSFNNTKPPGAGLAPWSFPFCGPGVERDGFHWVLCQEEMHSKV